MAKKKSEDKNNHNGDGSKKDDASNYDEEPSFSDPEGFVDDISDEGNLAFASPCVCLWKWFILKFCCVNETELLRNWVKWLEI